MKKPETYTELVRWFNCQQLKKYYDISDDELEKIYFLVSKGWNVNGTRDVLYLVDSSGNLPSINMSVVCTKSSIEGVSITGGTSFRVSYPASHYSSYSGGSSSNNNNNNNNNNH